MVNKQIEIRGENIQMAKVLLKTIAYGGALITLAVLAPNCVQLLAKIDPDIRKNKRRYYYVNTALKRLINRGLVKIEINHRGQRVPRLTKAGSERLALLELGEFQIKKPRRWDGKYHVVIFDIKEFRRRLRDKIRQQLINLGFVKLQNSVWVYPYDCSEVVTMLKAGLGIGKDVLHLKVDAIEDDYWLKKEFGLI